MLQELLIILSLLCMVWVFIIKNKNKKKEHSEPPDLSGKLPIIGHGHLVMGDPVKIYKALANFSMECLEKGGVVTMQLGPITKVYGVTDPEDALTILNSCLERHYFYSFSKPFLGNGLLSADVSRWKKHRKLITPAFNQHVLDSYIDIFNSQAQSVVDQFATKLGKPFDHQHVIRINALKSVCSTACGINPNEFSELFEQYLDQVEKWLVAINMRFLTVWLHNDFIYNLTPEKNQLDKELKQFLALSKSILEKAKAKKTSENIGTKEEKPKSFVDLMIALTGEAGSFTEEEVREETDTMIVSAHETSASALTIALTLLGSYENVQEMAYEEILDVCGNTDKPLNKEDLSRLVYVDAVLKETLRLYPVVFVMPRHIDKDVQLKNYTIKANSSCFVLSHGLLRHSMWGPDAEQFRPERWLDKETLPDPKYYGVFGMGRRACIGRAYAMLSMKIVLVHVLRKYQISSDASKMVIKFHSMARPESGYFITLEKRDQIYE